MKWVLATLLALCLAGCADSGSVVGFRWLAAAVGAAVAGRKAIAQVPTKRGSPSRTLRLATS
jgi:hypothetical protein